MQNKVLAATKGLQENQPWQAWSLNRNNLSGCAIWKTNSHWRLAFPKSSHCRACILQKDQPLKACRMELTAIEGLQFPKEKPYRPEKNKPFRLAEQQPLRAWQNRAFFYPIHTIAIACQGTLPVCTVPSSCQCLCTWQCRDANSAGLFGVPFQKNKCCPVRHWSGWSIHPSCPVRNLGIVQCPTMTCLPGSLSWREQSLLDPWIHCWDCHW